jgi:hypothetical protein
MVGLFGSYAEITDRIDISIQQGQYLTFNRDIYFYSFVAIFLIISTLIWIVARILPQLPERNFGFPNKAFWFSDKDNQRTRKDVLKAWPLTVGASINVLLLLFARNLSLENHVDSNPSSLPTYWFLVGISLFLVSLVSGFVRFSIRKQHLVVAMEPR